MTLETKCFELRDEGTFIPVMATRMAPDRDARVSWLLRRAGYPTAQPWCVVLARMDADGGPRQASYDEYSWGGRTFPNAHQYIRDNWDALVDGQLIDVRVILGENADACPTEFSDDL